MRHATRFLALVVLLGAVAPTGVRAGPPYLADDPEPVELHHWEIYVGTQDELTHEGATGLAPLVEVNFGVAPEVQLHVIVPLAFSRPRGGSTSFGPGDVELGAKLRLVQEGEGVPMVGVFPLVELPAGSQSRGLGSGHVHAFLPVWLQKSFGPWSTYGGGGFWINPGAGNRSYWSVGWQAQRKLSELATLGAELFYTAPDHVGGKSNTRFNVGLVLDLTEHHHVLASAGRSIVGDTTLLGYFAYQLTL